jgi:Galactokinase galactose-binding signature
MGDHTDYNEGFVLPVAIDRDCLIGVRPRADGLIAVRSLDVEPDEAVVEVMADGTDEPSRVEPGWGRYVAGVVRALAERERPPVGMDRPLVDRAARLRSFLERGARGGIRRGSLPRRRVRDELEARHVFRTCRPIGDLCQQ